MIIQGQFQGQFKLCARDALTHEIKRETPWLKNLILDQGLNNIAGGQILSQAHVGDDATPPAVTDVALGSWVSSTSQILSTSTSTETAEPYFSTYEVVFRWNEDVFTGIVREIGIGQNANNLFSRMILKDEYGDPFEFEIQVGEVLDLTYKLKMYPPTQDFTSQVSLGGTLYTITSRSALVTSASEWDLSRIDDGASPLPSFTDHAIYDGPIQDITQAPTGNSINAESVSENTYLYGSLRRRYTLYWNTGDNISVNSVLTRTNIGAFQHEFNPTIDKSSRHTLELIFSMGWNRV